MATRVPNIATATQVSADTVLGVVAASGAVKRLAASPSFGQLSAATGAGLVGYDEAETYAAGTLGAVVQTVASGVGTTNLAATLSATNIVVTSDTGTDATLPAADGTNAGLMVPAQVTKLSGIATGATANSSDATLLARANHTGTQAATTISDFAATVRSTVLTGLSTAAGTVVDATHTVLEALGFLQKQVSDNTTAIAGKQATLVSGTNIKTINGSPVLGSGDLVVTGSGLGDVVGPASATANNVVLFDGTTGKLLKDSGATLSGTNTGDETATSVGTLISGATDKATPVDADTLGLSDSAASNILKKLTWANLQATLKTYFDTQYSATDHNHTGTYEPADATILKDADIGVSVQAYDADLTSWAGIAPAAKQDALVSGTNIKTLNGSSVLGSGDLTISGGTLVPLSQVSASNSATVDVETTFDGTYDEYVLIASGVVPASDGLSFNAVLKIGGAYDTAGNYKYHLDRSISTSGTYAPSVSETATAIQLANSVGNAAGESLSFRMNIHQPASTALFKSVDWDGVAITGAGAAARCSGVAYNVGSTAAMTGVRFSAGSGNITSGTFRLYGIKNS